MKKYLIYCVFTMAALGCGKSGYKEGSAEATASLDSMDTTATEKIIKTADMQFRVKDVQQTKEKLSQAIKSEGGTIAEFSISSNIQQTEKVPYKTDSLLELTSYRTEGQITAKVPSAKLDEFTNKVAKMAIFVHHQSMKMDDLSLNYLSNQMKNQNRVEATEQLNRNATKKSNNVETALVLKDDYIDKKIANLDINNRVKYSDITLSFYQDNTVKQVVVGNDNLSDYRPPFFQRLLLSIQNGWFIFKEFIILLTNIWMLLLFGLLVYFGLRYYKKQKRNVAA
ncbi:DUF4349 domain-containing protein [Pedobacter sp. BAL39]|uniref:DUF4349 domain-containing protein n=1 Tax=Pedobacter sp. BAL39 TaxID=391596 RepID=UPI0012F7AD3A|nr:DUF4349 domain-containing protein [Pedobacter sp. BAL39]